MRNYLRNFNGAKTHRDFNTDERISPFGGMSAPIYAIISPNRYGGCGGFEEVYCFGILGREFACNAGGTMW